MHDGSVLFGQLVETTSYVEHISRIYTPYNTYTISAEDFANGRVKVYGSDVHIFQTDKVKEGTVFAAVFKEDASVLSKAASECHPVNDEDDKKLLGSSQKDNTSEEEIDGDIFNVIPSEETQKEEKPKEFETFKKEYIYENKKKHIKSDDETVEIKRTYSYPSFSYKSKYLETITAEYDDEAERLDLTLRTQDINTVISAVSEALGIEASNIRLTGLSYFANFDEYFLSTIRAAIIASKAAEKYGKKVVLTYRPLSVSPSLDITKTTVISKDGSVVYSEDIQVDADVGNSFIISEDCADIIASSVAPLYGVKKLSTTVRIMESSSLCTLFFAGFIKAAPSSCALEHAHQIAFALGLDPVEFIENSLGSEGNNEMVLRHAALKGDMLKNTFSKLLKEDDIYMQSAVFSMNNKKNKVFLSPLSAVNKAVITSVVFVPTGISRSFEKRNAFSVLMQKDQDGDRRLYLGAQSDESNKNRIEDALKQYESSSMRVGISIMPRGYKGKPFCAGPDISCRHTSVVAAKIKELVESEASKSVTPILQGIKNTQESSEVWGICAVNGYKDFVSDELVITSVHMILPHSSFYSTNDDYMYYKRMMLKIFSLFKVRFPSSFDDSKDIKIEFIERESVFDSTECVFPLMLSSLRLLSYYLSPNRKKTSVSDVHVSEDIPSQEEQVPETEDGSLNGENNDDKL